MNNTEFYIIIALVVVLLMFCPIIPAFGATEKECVLFSSNHLVQLYGSSDYPASCSWLVDKLLFNGSGFKVTDFDLTDGYIACDCYIWILTKN